MSRGLGTVQRMMLFQLACHEVQAAEASAQRQQPYRSPDRWSLADLIYSLSRTDNGIREKIDGRQRSWHAFRVALLRNFNAREESAREYYKTMVSISAASRGATPSPPMNEAEFVPRRLATPNSNGSTRPAPSWGSRSVA